MSEQPSRSVWGRPLQFVCNVCATLASAGRLGEALVQRTLGHWRQSALRPSPPLVHVVSGGSFGAQGSGDTLGSREPHVPFAQVALPALTRQRLQAFMLSLPAWLPRPEQRRHGHGQVALEWVGDQSRRFSVVIGQDDMIIYTARLGVRGRFDGAEPFGTQISPIVIYALQQLHD
ncbi:MAG: hypothetical protein AB7G13_07130 [Lautropia sp.]